MLTAALKLILKTSCYRHLFVSALTAALVMPAIAADSSELYLGISRATPGEARLAYGPTTTISNNNSPMAFKVYGGLSINREWAVELGYGAFGSWRFTDPTPGSHDAASVSSRAATVAARYTLDLGDSFAAFGKLGLAANRFRYRDNLGQSAGGSFVRPMWGIGVELKLGDHLSAPLEFEYLGAGHTSFGEYRQQKLEFGLRYKF